MGEFVMHRLFPIVCNMSLTASVVILAVLAGRLLLGGGPPGPPPLPRSWT